MLFCSVLCCCQRCPAGAVWIAAAYRQLLTRPAIAGRDCRNAWGKDGYLKLEMTEDGYGTCNMYWYMVCEPPLPAGQHWRLAGPAVPACCSWAGALLSLFRRPAAPPLPAASAAQACLQHLTLCAARRLCPQTLCRRQWPQLQSPLPVSSIQRRHHGCCSRACAAGVALLDSR